MDKHNVIILTDHSCFSLHTRECLPPDSARDLHDKQADIRDQKQLFRYNNAE